MEDDEQSPAEETAEVETPEQTTVLEDAGSEAVKTPSEDTGKGDLRVPLKQAREELRALRERLNDPDFVYERAQAVGLAQSENPTPQVNQPAPLTAGEVRRQIRAEKALEKYPELRENSKLQLMASALIADGMDPVDAADEIFSFANKTTEKAKSEAVAETRAEVGEREKAQMASGVRTDPESERTSQIQKDMRSPIKSVQEAATLEWLKNINKKSGLV